VFADCEVEQALDALSFGVFLYSGQSCTAATRIIVERTLYDEFVAGEQADERAGRVVHRADQQAQGRLELLGGERRPRGAALRIGAGPPSGPTRRHA
jgi:hypothetical protein